MSTEILIALQVILVLVIALVMLALILMRQKNTINQLKQILTTVKDDISGDNLTGYFQLEIDNTTAHCKQETVVLKPDLAPEDMAVSLRYLVLQAELALIQDYIGAENTPWREQIKNYVSIAEKITDIIKKRVDHATKTLTDSHNEEISVKDSAIAELEQKNQQQDQQLTSLQPLQDFISSSIDGDMSRLELEQSLHKALLSLCENFSNSENFRELVFLLHESFNESQSNSGSGKSEEAAPSSADSTDQNAQQQNIDILNNIIDHQKNMIKKLKDQMEKLEIDDIELIQTVEELAKETDKSSEQLADITPSTSGNDNAETSDEVNEVIEQFIEESAVMVEKIHLLTMEKKQLEQEKQELQNNLSNSLSNEGEMDEATNVLLEQKDKEIMELQKNLADMEERYLSLYKDQPAEQS